MTEARKCLWRKAMRLRQKSERYIYGDTRKQHEALGKTCALWADLACKAAEKCDCEFCEANPYDESKHGREALLVQNRRRK